MTTGFGVMVVLLGSAVVGLGQGAVRGVVEGERVGAAAASACSVSSAAAISTSVDTVSMRRGIRTIRRQPSQGSRGAERATAQDWSS